MHTELLKIHDIFTYASRKRHFVCVFCSGFLFKCQHCTIQLVGSWGGIVCFSFPMSLFFLSGGLIYFLCQTQTSSNLPGKNYCNSGLQKVVKPDLPHKQHGCPLMGKHAMELLTPSPSRQILFTLFLLRCCDHNQSLFSSTRKEDMALPVESSRRADSSSAHTVAAFTLSH